MLKKLTTAEQQKELEAYCAKLFQVTPDGPSTEDICDIQAANKNLVDSINAWGTEDLGVGEVREIGDVDVLRACFELRGPCEDQQLGSCPVSMTGLNITHPGIPNSNQTMIGERQEILFLWSCRGNNLMASTAYTTCCSLPLQHLNLVS